MPGADAGPAKHLARKSGDRERWIKSMVSLQRRFLSELELTRP